MHAHTRVTRNKVAVAFRIPRTSLPERGGRVPKRTRSSKWILGGGASAMQEQSPGGGRSVPLLYVQLSSLDTDGKWALTYN